MPNTKNQINNGVGFEEDVIAAIIADITETKEMKSLPQEKRDRIITLLQGLVIDSRRHKKLLTALAAKY